MRRHKVRDITSYDKSRWELNHYDAHNYSVCAPVVAACDCSEALLTSSVPLQQEDVIKDYHTTKSRSDSVRHQEGMRKLTICSLITLPSSSTVRIFCDELNEISKRMSKQRAVV